MGSDDAFAMIERAAWEDEPPVIHVALNWAAELRAKSAEPTGVLDPRL